MLAHRQANISEKKCKFEKKVKKICQIKLTSTLLIIMKNVIQYFRYCFLRYFLFSIDFQVFTNCQKIFCVPSICLKLNHQIIGVLINDVLNKRLFKIKQVLFDVKSVENF